MEATKRVVLLPSVLSGPPQWVLKKGHEDTVTMKVLAFPVGIEKNAVYAFTLNALFHKAQEWRLEHAPSETGGETYMITTLDGSKSWVPAENDSMMQIDLKSFDEPLPVKMRTFELIEIMGN